MGSGTFVSVQQCGQDEEWGRPQASLPPISIFFFRAKPLTKRVDAGNNVTVKVLAAKEVELPLQCCVTRFDTENSSNHMADNPDKGRAVH